MTATFGTGVARASEAFDCAGTATVEVAAPSLQGAGGSVCMPAGAFYEVRVAGWELLIGLGVRSDSPADRIGFAQLTSPHGAAAALVGLEDSAAQVVRFAYAEGSRSADGPFSADGITDLADETAHLSLSVTGTPADLLTAPGPVAAELRDLLQTALAELT